MSDCLITVIVHQSQNVKKMTEKTKNPAPTKEEAKPVHPSPSTKATPSTPAFGMTAGKAVISGAESSHDSAGRHSHDS